MQEFQDRKDVFNKLLFTEVNSAREEYLKSYQTENSRV